MGEVTGLDGGVYGVRWGLGRGLDGEGYGVRWGSVRG